MQTFWRLGYTATTYAALEAATGQRRQSLVYAFGDKHKLFCAALKFYTNKRLDQLEAALKQGDSAKDGLHVALQAWVEDARNLEHPGCLMVTTAGEVGAFDEAIAQQVEQARQSLIGLFSRALAAARQEGSLRVPGKPIHLANLLVSACDGALLYARNGRSPEDAAESVSTLLAILF